MNSTSRRIFTRFVPESITGGIAAGQDSGERYRSLLEMKRTTGFADQRERGGSAADQQVQVPGSTGSYRGLPARVVPDFYRRMIDNTAALAVAALLYPAVVWAYRDERREAGAR